MAETQPITDATCPDCGETKTRDDADDTGYVTCFGTGDDFHTTQTLFRPCGLCNTPTTNMVLCTDCRTEYPDDAFDTNWDTDVIDAFLNTANPDRSLDTNPLRTNTGHIENYDVDPTQMHTPNQIVTADTDTDTQNLFACIDGSNVWMSYQQDRDNWGGGYTVKAFGWLDGVEPIKPDVALLRTTLQKNAVEVLQQTGESAVEQLCKTVFRNAADLARTLQQKYIDRFVALSDDYLENRVLHVEGTRVWFPEKDGGLETLADMLVYEQADGVELQPTDTAAYLLEAALRDVIQKYRVSPAMEGAEFIGELVITDFGMWDDWPIRALELEHNGVFQNKEELCNVAALRERGRSQKEIADLLGKSPSTVSQQVSEIRNLIARSEWTVDHGPDPDLF